MDQIIVLKNGEVSEVGTYRELLEQKGDFADFLIQYLSEKGTTDADIADAAGDAESADVVLQIKHELESRIGTVELGRQLSRARTESECARGGSSEVGNNQRRGSDESMRSGGARSNQSGRSPSPRKQQSATSPDRRVSGDHAKTPPAATDGKKPSNAAAAAGNQYQEEKAETGEVSWRIYGIYFRNMGYVLFSACVFLYTVYQASFLADFWCCPDKKK